jgi:hypothetical protein
MKRKYVTVQVLLACLSRPARKRENIHVLLAMTIAERKRIMREWKQSFFGKEKDIHAMLAETIAERKETLKEWEKVFDEDEWEEDYKLEERDAA